MNVNPTNSEPQLTPGEDFTQFLVDGFIDVNALLKKKRELKLEHPDLDGAGPVTEC